MIQIPCILFSGSGKIGSVRAATSTDLEFVEIFKTYDRPYSLTFDYDDQHLYWTDRSSVYRCRLNGSDFQNIYNSSTGVGKAW